MGKAYDLTEKEVELLEALQRQDTVWEAARHLRISQGAAEQRLFRLRMRYDLAVTFVDKYRSWKSRLGRRYL